jgi:hypothetical protein
MGQGQINAETHRARQQTGRDDPAKKPANIQGYAAVTGTGHASSLL